MFIIFIYLSKNSFAYLFCFSGSISVIFLLMNSLSKLEYASKNNPFEVNINNLKILKNNNN